MKKYILILSSIVIVLFIIVINVVNRFETREVLENVQSNKMVSENTLTMMYETEADSGEYQVSSDTTWPQDGYVFNESLSSCENGSTLSWDDENKRVLMQANTSDKCYVYFDKKPDIVYLADYIINNVYTGVDGENGLYYHDGVGSYTNADQEAGDNSYRYSGANLNNYVCFGSDDLSCPEDDLYRIIGVYGNQVKLIKYDYANSDLLGTDGAYNSSTTSLGDYYNGSQSTLYLYFWNNDTGRNIWSESNLNTINLNTNYLNNIGSTWASKIAEHTWQVGGNMPSNIYSVSVKSTYTNEIISPLDATTFSGKVGLMYASDYGYASSPDNWSKNLYDYANDTNRNNNWMFMGLDELTITNCEQVWCLAFSIESDGSINFDGIGGLGYGSVRPTFYLNSNVTYVSGTGTQTDPYRIA